MKTLIAYFSRSGQNYVNGNIVELPVGNTEVVAEMIKARLPEAELFHIDTVEPYSDDYMTCTEEARHELHDNTRPALKQDIDPAGFDTIILGYPNWWGTMPMAVRTWLDGHDFTGKTIIPYCTHEGSGMGHSEIDLQKAAPGATVRNGVAIHGSEVRMAHQQVSQIINESLK